MGRYDESIAQYRKALSIDPHFNASRFGISADSRIAASRRRQRRNCRSMADRRATMANCARLTFGMAVLASDSGKYDQALAAMDKEYAVAEKKGDEASMAADLQAKGNIMSRWRSMMRRRRSLIGRCKLIADSNLSQEIKNNATLLHHFNAAAVAIAKKDLAGAKSHAERIPQGRRGQRRTTRR